MDFKIEKNERPEPPKSDKEELKIAYAFAREIFKEFDRLLKAVVLFGSTLRRPHVKPGDIDILLVIDDVGFKLTPELVETYRIVTEKIILKTSRKLHVTTLKFTSFWEYVRVGDPVGINILRDGLALIDTGIFYPMQLLLFQGRIRPSLEAVQVYFSRSPVTLHNSKWHVMQATVDLYWAAIDAAHAAVMNTLDMPPNPSEMAKTLDEKFVKHGMLDAKYVKIMDELYHTSKGILHREIANIDGKDYDRLNQQTWEFVDAMKRVIEKTGEQNAHRKQP